MAGSLDDKVGFLQRLRVETRIAVNLKLVSDEEL